MAWDHKLFDSMSVTPVDCVYSCCCMPCAWGELYGADQGEQIFQPQCLLGTLIGCVPILNCYFMANRRSEQMEKLGMYVDYLEVCSTICVCPSNCFAVHQERLQYHNSGQDPKLVLME